MLDAVSATEQALFDALDAGITGATVWQDAPEDAELDLVILGDLTGRPLGVKGDPDRIITATIFFQTAGEERAPLLKLQAQALEALDDQTLTGVEGWQINPTFVSATAELAEDGETYVGVSTFEVFALTA
jgi:predicted phosphohydrolase